MNKAQEVLEKNTSKDKIRIIFERDDVSLGIMENQAESLTEMATQVKKSIIHFYFCMDGNAVFEFGPHYRREIQKQWNYFFYNPEKDLPFTLKLSPFSKLVVLTISLESLHKLFVHDALPFPKPENINRVFYYEREIPANLYVVLNQLFSMQVSESSEKLYYHAKSLELLSLYFSSKKDGSL